MGAAIQLRSDYTADDLHRLARASRDAKQTRRLLALASPFMKAAAGARRQGSAGSACKSSGTGWCASMRMTLTACSIVKRPARRLASAMPSVPRLLKRLRPDRNLIWMASSAGGLPILSSGCARNSAYRSAATR